MTDWGLVIGLVGLTTGIILSMLAIGLSAFFYTQAKNTEGRVQTALGEIRQQTDSLQRLSGRMLDRLTRAVTEGRPDHEHRQMLFFVEAMRTVYTGNAVPTSQPTVTPEMRASMVQLCAGTYLYAAIANVFLQDLLPESVSEVGEELRRMIDMTSADVTTLHAWLEAPADDWPTNARAMHDTAVNYWRPRVRDTLAAYQARSARFPDAATE